MTDKNKLKNMPDNDLKDYEVMQEAVGEFLKGKGDRN